MDKNIGKKLDGRYEIIELIGEGGMADVYKAVDIVDNKTIAVKILKKEFAENEEFLRLCKAKVAEYTNAHMDKTDRQQIHVNDVYLVWSCKALQNNKALLSTTVPDGMYYELTYNGDKKELYLDAYKKFENQCFKM